MYLMFQNELVNSKSWHHFILELARNESDVSWVTRMSEDYVKRYKYVNKLCNSLKRNRVHVTLMNQTRKMKKQICLLFQKFHQKDKRRQLEKKKKEKKIQKKLKKILKELEKTIILLEKKEHRKNPRVDERQRLEKKKNKKSSVRAVKRHIETGQEGLPCSTCWYLETTV